jgi:hypothetical protein
MFKQSSRMTSQLTPQRTDTGVQCKEQHHLTETEINLIEAADVAIPTLIKFFRFLYTHDTLD